MLGSSLISHYWALSKVSGLGQEVHQPGSEIPEASSCGCTVNNRNLVVVVEGGRRHDDGGGAGSPTLSGNCSGKPQRALLKLTGRPSTASWDWPEKQ